MSVGIGELIWKVN